MNLIYLTLILSSLVILCVQSSEINNKNGTMRIELRRQKTPYEQYLNAPDLSKYGFGFEWFSKKHKNGSARTNDSIALHRWLDNEFYGTIVIGHPGQTLDVAFDTAWSQSWVLSSRCKGFSKRGCFFHHKYNHDKSSEYKKDGRPYVSNDGKYKFSGFYSYDNISIAHSNVTHQSFIEMTNVSDSFMLSKIDGVLGLGLQVGNYEPFFYKLLRQNKIKNPIFSVYLNRASESSKGGNIMLGFYDEKHIHKNRINNKTIPENITYLSVEAGQYWKFPVDKIIIKDQTFCANGCKAIPDTSSNTIVGPTEDIAKIHDIIDADEFILGRYRVKCETVNKLPPITFVLNGQKFTLKGPQYIMKMTYEGFAVCVSAFIPTETPVEKGLWILGGAFLAEYYTIYDVQNKLFGVVKAAV